jgi:hypothetical protein
MALTKEQQAVIAASALGRKKMLALDALALAAVVKSYQGAVQDIVQLVTVVAGGAGGTVAPAALPSLMLQVHARLGNLAGARNATLMDGIQQAATIGATPFTPTVNAAQLDSIRIEAAQFTRDVVGPDKLKLSDRIWRLDRHANEIVSQEVRNAVMRGDGAAQAAREFLARGIAPPADIALAKNAAIARNIGATVEKGLLTGRGAPLDNAMRVMTTEINRAHTTAYQKSAAADPDSIGTQFLLSPRHPRVDICDMHARANLHGLGPGVYPHGRSPLPAHPRTLSFEVIVYRDEVTAADRAGKQTVTEFLDTVPSHDRKGILGVNKNEAFEAGKLPATQVRSRWRDVQKRIGRNIESQ